MDETEHVVTQQCEAWVVREGLLEEGVLKLAQKNWEVEGRASLAGHLSRGLRQDGARLLHVAMRRWSAQAPASFSLALFTRGRQECNPQGELLAEAVRQKAERHALTGLGQASAQR